MHAKKGDLALSVNAIVIVVISFVVLGLALTLTRNIFKIGTETVGAVIPLTELEAQPTAENTITISDTTSITKGGTLTLSVGYYNKNNEPAEDATFSIVQCQDERGDTVDGADQPKIQSPSQKVPQSDKRGFKIILVDSGKLQTGVYICTAAVHHKSLRGDTSGILDKLPNAGTAGNKVYDSKQFFYKVTA